MNITQSQLKKLKRRNDKALELALAHPVDVLEHFMVSEQEELLFNQDQRSQLYRHFRGWLTLVRLNHEEKSIQEAAVKVVKMMRRTSPIEKTKSGLCLLALIVEDAMQDGGGKVKSSGGRDFGITRRPAVVSHTKLGNWQISDPATVAAVEIEGQLLTAQVTDLTKILPPPSDSAANPGKQIQFQISIPALRTNVRLAAVAALGHNSTLKADTLTLLSLAHALAWPVPMDIRTLATYLARTAKGDFRRPQKRDVERAINSVWAAMYLSPIGTDGLPKNLIFFDNPDNPSEPGTFGFGPPAWLRQKGERYTLTAEGGVAGRARVKAGEGRSGRIITGAEFWLTTRFSGQAGIAPDLQPERKGGSGRLVRLNWRQCLQLAGDQWDVTDPKADHAARKRFDYYMVRLTDEEKGVGYNLPMRTTANGQKVHNLRGEAQAGDSIEIVERIRGGRTHEAGLVIRASARFCAAAAADFRREYELVPLADWTGNQRLDPRNRVSPIPK